VVAPWADLRRSTAPTRSVAAILVRLAWYAIAAAALVCGAPRRAAASMCPLGVDAGARAGISINGDQWIGGGHGRLRLTCLGGLGLEPVAIAGLGGNYLTLRPSLRFFYWVWLDAARRWSLAPALGASLVYYTPVGNFATFCHRYDVDACSGFSHGFEAGMSAGFSGLGLQTAIGFGGLPVVTLSATYTWPLSRTEGTVAR
jgi:hypothetical protein